mmetsp:Transcript_24138/g.47466  ORF Transcript_24138/g.47466 Transcript_24138/m.47466 type:complete len:135 (-) Transcript_24138:1032-1436(-)
MKPIIDASFSTRCFFDGNSCLIKNQFMMRFQGGFQAFYTESSCGQWTGVGGTDKAGSDAALVFVLWGTATATFRSHSAEGLRSAHHCALWRWRKQGVKSQLPSQLLICLLMAVPRQAARFWASQVCDCWLLVAV